MPSLTELPVSTPTLPTPTGQRAVPAAVYLPIGLANPIWFAFTAAAGAGAAFWMMTRFVRPMNLEALAGALKPANVDPRKVGELVETAAKPVVQAAKVADSAVATVSAAARQAPTVVADAVDQAAGAVEQQARSFETTIERAPQLARGPEPQPRREPAPAQPAVETAAEGVADFAKDAADDLTKLVGIGPRTAAALADHGVKSFADLAGWSQQQLAEFDNELGLKGRSLREGWIEQARALAGQK